MNPPKQLRNGVWGIDGDILSRWVEERGLNCDAMARETIAPIIQPGWHVIDGGAALGDHTSIYLNRVGPSGVVHAFEPNPNFLECLKANCPAAVPHPEALWNKEAELWLCLCPENLGGSILVRERAPGLEYAGPVRAITLDSLNLERLDFMKLDLEGTEHFALLGAEQTIARHHPIMVLEMNPGPMRAQDITPEMVWEFLAKHGYTWKSICGEPQANCQHCDILCHPRR